MAWSDWSTTGTGSVQYWDSSATADTTANVNWGPSATDASTWFHVVRTMRRILVNEPEHWGAEDKEGFVRLVNHETNTGWIVEMVIDGDVLITDPDIEVRSMADFVPLPKQRAGTKDTDRIVQFFEEHPLADPDDSDD